MNYQNNIFSPVNALPTTLREAIVEVQTNVQVPIELVVSSALGALSLASQDKITVRRPNGLESPCGLFLITIADSGERKTSCDKLFIQPIRDMEVKAEIAHKSDLDNYESDLMAWSLKTKALESRLLKNKNTEIPVQEILRAQYAEKPCRPRCTSLILRDTTPEAIAWHLHTVYPSAGLVSDEGGQILNGRAADQLPKLNVLWDGGDLKVNRKDSESFTVRNVRFTVSLMLQSCTFEKFLEGKGKLARDNGFLARNLVCKPRSMQGQRRISSIEVAKFPKLEIFQARIADLLEENHSRGGDGQIQATTLEFSPDAKILWIEFANYIESNINIGAKYAMARDAASKTAENVARLAALFHHFEGQNGPIQPESVNQALQICEWYLVEFIRIFCPQPPIPQHQQDAEVLDTWLRQRLMMRNEHMCKKNDVRQLGPTTLRNIARLNSAIDTLIMSGRIRVVQEIRTKTWWIELFKSTFPYQPSVIF